MANEGPTWIRLFPHEHCPDLRHRLFTFSAIGQLPALRAQQPSLQCISSVVRAWIYLGCCVICGPDQQLSTALSLTAGIGRNRSLTGFLRLEDLGGGYTGRPKLNGTHLI